MPWKKTGSPLVVGVLVASLAVTAALGWQALRSARERAAISEAMLRQYAQLASWEFARHVRGETEQRLMQTLNTYAHPESRQHKHGPCNCLALEAVEHWFEIDASGRVGSDRDTVLRALAEAGAQRGLEGGGAETGLRIAPIPGDRQRFAALKDEPHLESGPGTIGLVTSVPALAPVLSHVYQNLPLLPPALLGGSRDAISVRVTDAAGAELFASSVTAGPFAATTDLWQDQSIVMRASVAMTPAFIASLGPEHRPRMSAILIGALLGVNALLVVVGVWQLRRERELSRLRENFVAGVSHELRTPLAQIRMFSETLLLDRVRNAAEERRALEIIGQESTRLSRLIDNVLLFHQGERGTALNSIQRVNLGDLVKDVVEAFEPLAASKGAHVSVSSPADPLLVEGDAGALRQVLLNLLDNAVKFGPPGQTIEVALVRGGVRAALVVDDAGPGIPVKERARVLEPFVRGAETRGTGGAGIGLAVVQQIVSAHGGHVTVSDAPGGGARVTVRLPLDHRGRE